MNTKAIASTIAALSLLFSAEAKAGNLWKSGPCLHPNGATPSQKNPDPSTELGNNGDTLCRPEEGDKSPKQPPKNYNEVLRSLGNDGDTASRPESP